MTFTDGDCLIIFTMLSEGGADDGDIVEYLEVLSEGVALGEADSMQLVESFRQKAAARPDALSIVVEIARFEEVLPRLQETAEFVRMVAHTKPGNRIHDFVTARRIGQAAETINASKVIAA